MTNSTLLKIQCPYCKKNVSTESEEIKDLEKKILYSCGHTVFQDISKIDKNQDIQSLTGKHPFQYQYDTLDFLVKSDFRSGIFHEMGLGKTICSLMAIKKYPEKLLPTVIFCKSSLKMQWLREVIEWTSLPAQLIETSQDKPYPELFKIFIVSIDMAKNLDWIQNLNVKLAIIDECQSIKNSGAKRTQAIRKILEGKEVRPRQIKYEVKSLERQIMIAKDLMAYHGLGDRFKLGFEDKLPIPQALAVCESESKREDKGIITGRIIIQKMHAMLADDSDFIDTVLHEIAHAICLGAHHSNIWHKTNLHIGGNGNTYSDWCAGTTKIEIQKEEFAIPHVLALSGTPIKRHAGEFFPILNILRPDIFHSEAQYLRDYCDTFQSGWGYKIGGLSSNGSRLFQDKTKDFILRYTREEKLPDLPKVFRKGFYLPLGKEVRNSYEIAFRDLQDEMMNPGQKSKFSEAGNILAKMNRLRHLTGVAKILPITEFVKDFIQNVEKEKIVVFVHHKDVGSGIYNGLDNWCLSEKIPRPLQLTSDIAGNDIGFRIDEKFKTDPEARILVASTLSAGEGKNWQMCSNMIMVEHQWNPGDEEQAEARFSRPGSIASSISATYAVAIGTIDEAMTEIKAQKREYVGKTLDGKEMKWDQDSFVREVANKLMTMGMPKWTI